MTDRGDGRGIIDRATAHASQDEGALQHYAKLWRAAVQRTDAGGMLDALRLGRPHGLCPDEPADRQGRSAISAILREDHQMGLHGQQAAMVSRLLALGTDPDLRDEDGLTAGDHATVSANGMAAAVVICRTLQRQYDLWGRHGSGKTDGAKTGFLTKFFGAARDVRPGGHPLQRIALHIPPEERDRAARNFLKVFEYVEEGLGLISADPAFGTDFLKWVKQEYPDWSDQPTLASLQPFMGAAYLQKAAPPPGRGQDETAMFAPV